MHSVAYLDRPRPGIKVETCEWNPGHVSLSTESLFSSLL